MVDRCFVIGPMAGESLVTLRWLAGTVQALLPDWDVATPDSSEIGNIMDQVIKSCDRADLVVANTTGNNPNVLYEIAVLDALGRACIPVKIVSKKTPRDQISFDRAAYRVFEIYSSTNKKKETLQILGDAITSALKLKADGKRFSNPITNHYRIPLSALSSAYGVARGYYENFIRHVVKNLPSTKIPNSTFDPTKFIGRELDVVIPYRFKDVSRASIADLLQQKIVKQITISAGDREISLFEWAKQEGRSFRWVDFPTALSSLRSNVFHRSGGDTSEDLEDFRVIEKDEIDQFERELNGLIKLESDEDFRSKVTVERWQRPAWIKDLSV